MSSTDFLYEKLAAELGDAIARGALRPGARLPSVRQLAEDRAVSTATVVQAYGLLEGTGKIEARPKSGFFVRARVDDGEAPRAPRKAAVATRPAVADGIARLMAALREPGVVPLAAAYLDPQTLRVAALNRIASALAREVSTLGARDEAPPGLLTLRRALARRSVSWGATLTEDDLVCTIGATEAITGDYRWFVTTLDRLSEVTLVDIERVRKQYLHPRNRTVGWYEPQGGASEGFSAQ